MNKALSIALAGAAVAALVAFSCSTETKEKKKDAATAAAPGTPTPGATPGPASPGTPAPAGSVECDCSPKLTIAFKDGAPQTASFAMLEKMEEEPGNSGRTFFGCDGKEALPSTACGKAAVTLGLKGNEKALAVESKSPDLAYRVAFAAIEKDTSGACGSSCPLYTLTLPDTTRGWYFCADESEENGPQVDTATVCAAQKTKCPSGKQKTFTYSQNDGGGNVTSYFWSCGAD